MDILLGHRLILSSASPRRRELLTEMGLPFTIDTDNRFNECRTPDMNPDTIPAIMSEGKSYGFHRALEKDEILLTADTMVICDGRPLGKPSGPEEAHLMLSFLSGKTHHVVTAITLRTQSRKITASDSASVTFKTLSEGEISYFINKYHPFDKAGAYAIQEWIGLIGITKIDGSFWTVMGLPTHLLYELLKEIVI